MPDSPHRPLRTLSFPLTRADALAWERLRHSPSGLVRFLFVVWLGSAGLTLALLPAAVAGAEGSLQFYAALLSLIGVHYGVAMLLRAGLRRWRAGRRVPGEVTVRVEVWGDHLAQFAGAGAPTIVAPELIRQVVLTPRHVFIDSPPEVLILPAAAFDGPEDMRSFAEHWDGLSRNAAN